MRYFSNWEVKDSSINGVIMQLLFSAIITMSFVSVFIILRNTWLGKPVYSPRIINIPEESPPYFEKATDWLKSLFTYNNSFILDNISLDAVMLLNFYKMGFYVCLIGTLVICPILTSLDYYSHNKEFIIVSVNNTNSTYDENFSENNLRSRSLTCGLPTPIRIEEDEYNYYYTFSKTQGVIEEIDDYDLNAYNNSLYNDTETVITDTEIIANGLNMSIQVFSIANVPNDSYVLIAHSFCCYLYSFIVMYYLLKNYKSYAQYYKENVKRGGIIKTRAIKSEVLEAKTVMIRNLPGNLQDKLTLIDWFNNLKIGKVDDIHVIKEMDYKLENALKNRKNALYNLEKAYQNFKNNIDKNSQKKNIVQRFIEKKVLKEFPNALNNLFNPNGTNNKEAEKDPEMQKKKKLRKLRPHHFVGTIYPLKGQFVDSISTYEKSLKKYTKEIEELRKKGSKDKSRAYTAFVTFKDTRAAHIVSQLTLYTSENVNTMSCVAAPKPTDLQWENLQSRVEKKQSMTAVIDIVLFFMCIFYIVPVSFILAFTELGNLQSIDIINSFLEKLVEYEVIKTFFENILPNLIVNILLTLVQYIIYLLTKFEYSEAFSMREESFLRKYFQFILFNVLFICTLSKTFWGVVKNAVDDPSSIISLLGEQLPKGANFFIIFIIYRIQAPANELAGLPYIAIGWLRKTFLCKTKRQIYDFEHETVPLNYGLVYPIPLLIFTIISVYSCISSFILIPGIFYFFLSYLVQKNNVIYKNVKKWENNGIYYNLIFNRIIFGLIIAQLTLIGMFSLKKNPTLSTSLIPLVVITIIFTRLCHNTFANIHKNTPIDQFVDGQTFTNCKSNLLLATYENIEIEKSNIINRSDSDVSISKEDLKICMLDALDSNLKDQKLMLSLKDHLDAIVEKFKSNIDNARLQVPNSTSYNKIDDINDNVRKKAKLGNKNNEEEKTFENNFGADKYIYITAQKKRKTPQYSCLAESEVPKLPDYYLESSYNHPNYTCDLYSPWIPDGLDESLIEHLDDGKDSDKKNQNNNDDEINIFKDKISEELESDLEKNCTNDSKNENNNENNNGSYPLIVIEGAMSEEKSNNNNNNNNNNYYNYNGTVSSIIIEEPKDENKFTTNNILKENISNEDFQDTKEELYLEEKSQSINIINEISNESKDNSFFSLPNNSTIQLNKNKIS